MLKMIEIKSKSPPMASIIWLHGLGASGHDFVDIAPLLNLPTDLNVHFIFPHAPMREVTYTGNAKIRAWFNISGLDRLAAEDECGIREAEGMVAELIDNELAQNIPSHKIILAGFSQGGAIALQCGLRYPDRLGGILVMSSWLLLKDKLAKEGSASNQQTPILMMHGSEDDVIPLSWSEDSRDYLRDLDYNVSLSSYPMGHTVCNEEISAIGEWLRTLLK